MSTRKSFSKFNTKSAMQMIGQENLHKWELELTPTTPSDALRLHLERLQCFDLTSTERAKELIIDALCAEVALHYPSLKIWKSAPLESLELTGEADYLVTPNRAYIDTPLLCAVEAKKDDFEKGLAQCLVELHACAELNEAAGLTPDLFGIVTNGQAWQFYHRRTDGSIAESAVFALRDMEDLLGALHMIFARCAANLVP
ncbi:hypothetical protein [Armatimonas sp.]|uniref:hypothetical protein n=1 Tax=Armatimonas sp. TaxID=1872638 RepID=UPI00286BEC23|nr:hypothetical protein [Armatimonas sp.]